MPVYNASKYLRQAIDSILNQTYSDFIFLIINDSSTDDSEKIIRSYTDKRIQYHKNEHNIGIALTLNKAIELTQTEYFARMDADDISVPNRLELQINFMKQHPEVGVCGGFFKKFGNENTLVTRFTEDEMLKATLFFANQICHPTVIVRTEVLKINNLNYTIPVEYNDNLKHTILELEDVFLWNKLKSKTRFANINEVLLHYRVEGQNFSTHSEEIIFERKKKYYLYLLNELNIIPSDKNLVLHISLTNFTHQATIADITNFRNHLHHILETNKKLNIYSPQALQKIIEQKWEQLFYFLPALGFKFVWKYIGISKRMSLKQVVYYLKN